jgi:hypothetical protein
MDEARKKDFALLLERLEKVMTTGEDILHVLEIQREFGEMSLLISGEQQREAIAAIQRRFDTFAAIQAQEYNETHPGSPLVATSSMTSSDDDVKRRHHPRRSSSEHRAFEEKALDVGLTVNLADIQALQRISGPLEGDVPDVSTGVC